MFYTFTSTDIFIGGDHEKPQADCTIKLDNGEVRVLTVDLASNRIVAIENILRQSIDALLNEEQRSK